MVETRVPYCSVCQSRYNEEDRVPLLLKCGHGFCRDCLSRMFAASTDINLPCPRCRTTSLVGNSVHALRKNYTVVGLIDDNSNSNFDDENTDDDADENEDEDLRPKRSSQAWISGCEAGMELGAHPEMKFLKKIGEGRRTGVEVWAAMVGAGGGRCKHRVAVKKVTIGEEWSDID